MEENIDDTDNIVQEFAEYIQIGNKVYKVKDLQGILDTRIPYWIIEPEVQEVNNLESEEIGTDEII